jgi:hypothetical protein
MRGEGVSNFGGRRCESPDVDDVGVGGRGSGEAIAGGGTGAGVGNKRRLEVDVESGRYFCQVEGCNQAKRSGYAQRGGLANHNMWAAKHHESIAEERGEHPRAVVRAGRSKGVTLR